MTHISLASVESGQWATTDPQWQEWGKSYVAKLGENIQVARFMRYNMGETQEEEEEAGPTLADEVASMVGR